MNSGQESLAPALPSTSIGARRSLNRDHRKKELMKITKENQLILKRLQEKTAHYNINKWENEYQQK